MHTVNILPEQAQCTPHLCEVGYISLVYSTMHANEPEMPNLEIRASTVSRGVRSMPDAEEREQYSLLW